MGLVFECGRTYKAWHSVRHDRSRFDELLGEGDSYVNDQLDVTVQDTEVLAEIEMMTNLIIATSESDGPAVPGPDRRDPRRDAR